MTEQWKQFYKQHRLKRLYRLFFPSVRELFLKKLRAAYIRDVTKMLEPRFFIEELKMSKTINIKGKEISEDTIIEALKKHCGFTEKEPLKAGDVVRDYGEIRIIVSTPAEGLVAYGLDGHSYSCWHGYKKIGTLDKIFIQAGYSI